MRAARLSVTLLQACLAEELKGTRPHDWSPETFRTRISGSPLWIRVTLHSSETPNQVGVFLFCNAISLSERVPSKSGWSANAAVTSTESAAAPRT
jgi:hypothetical protein